MQPWGEALLSRVKEASGTLGSVLSRQLAHPTELKAYLAGAAPLLFRGRNPCGVVQPELLSSATAPGESLIITASLILPFLRGGEAPTQVHVNSSRSLRIRDVFVHCIEDLLFDLSDGITVQHLHRDLWTVLVIRIDAV